MNREIKTLRSRHTGICGERDCNSAASYRSARCLALLSLVSSEHTLRFSWP
jgi:hypothetical protein